MPSKVKKKGKTPKELMRKHISNKEDIITHEEFANMEIGIAMELSDEKPLDLPENKDRPKDEDKDPGILTPWDVIA